MKHILSRSIILPVLVLMVSPLAMPNAFAVAPAFPTSGTCTLLATASAPVNVTSGTSGVLYNVLGQLTFTSSTAGTATFTGGSGTFGTGGPTASQAFIGFTSIPFTVGAATSLNLPNAMAINIPTGTLSALIFTAVPANGGNTLLMTQTGSSYPPMSGVCQF